MDPDGRIVDAAGERLLVALEANPLIHERVLRYLTSRDRRRIARRMAKGVVETVFRELAESVRDVEVDVRTPFPKTVTDRRGALELRWCLTCEAPRYAYYQQCALRCMVCRKPTVELDEDQLTESDRRLPSKQLDP